MSVSRKGRLIEITDAEHLIVVGDLHTDIPDFNWIKRSLEQGKGKTHIVFLGDYFYRLPFEDYQEIKGGCCSYDKTRAQNGNKALKILKKITELEKQYIDNFHVLAGNCELRLKQGDNRRPSTQEFEKMVKSLECLESIGICFPDIRRKFIDSIDNMPLFAIVKVVRAGTYYLSHSGIVKTHNLNNIITSCSDLINFNRNNPCNFDKACYVRLQNETINTQQQTVHDVLKALGCDYMISGHIHIDGAKAATELPALDLRRRAGHSVACADKVYVINSFSSGAYASVLEMTAGTMKPEPHKVLKSS